MLHKIFPITVKTPKVIWIAKQRNKVFWMIKNLENLVTITLGNVVTCMVDHIVNVNKKIQNIVWEGGLLIDAKKYKALKSALFPQYRDTLDLLWTNEKINKSYERLMKFFVRDCVRTIALVKSGSSPSEVSTVFLGISVELYFKLVRSILVKFLVY